MEETSEEEAVESSGKRADIFAPRSTGRMDERSGKKRRRGRRSEREAEEEAMNFALPEDEGAKEERGGAREEATHGGKK